MSRLSLIAAVFCFLAGPAAADDDPAPAPELPPERVVEIQLDALQHNDDPYTDAGIERAWAFAHPANKIVTGPLERFATMIKSPGYRMLVDHRDHAIRRVVVTGSSALVAVTITPASGPVVFYQWQLQKVGSGELEGVWMTISVSPPIGRGDTI